MNSRGQYTAVERDPATVSGAWVFAKTRVPVRALFENLEDGATIDEFVEWFPGVTRKQVEAVLEFTPTLQDTSWKHVRVHAMLNPPESTAP